MINEAWLSRLVVQRTTRENQPLVLSAKPSDKVSGKIQYAVVRVNDFIQPLTRLLVTVRKIEPLKLLAAQKRKDH
jgi:hypothetical protein